MQRYVSFAAYLLDFGIYFDPCRNTHSSPISIKSFPDTANVPDTARSNNPHLMLTKRHIHCLGLPSSNMNCSQREARIGVYHINTFPYACEYIAVTRHTHSIVNVVYWVVEEPLIRQKRPSGIVCR